jgi:hypothetical protein
LNLITCIVLIDLVTAINSLYISLGSPVLPGWVGTGGDPCGEGWQGIVCNVSEIQSMYGALLWSHHIYCHLSALIM